MADMKWQEAIQKILGSSPVALHYREITEKILEEGLRKSVGASPAATVNAQLSNSIKVHREDSPYRRTAKGIYTLRDRPIPPQPLDEDEDIEPEISFGAFWERDAVDWKRNPNLYGVFQSEAVSKSDPTRVNFSGQHGVYLLHDVREVIYVGRTTKGDLGSRLYDHTRDRLQGRWNRFSWFGFRPVSETGELGQKLETLPEKYGMESLIATMEAVLIEALEPRQNRKRGDGMDASEYRQVPDPEVEKKSFLKGVQDLVARGRTDR